MATKCDRLELEFQTFVDDLIRTEPDKAMSGHFKQRKTTHNDLIAAIRAKNVAEIAKQTKEYKDLNEMFLSKEGIYRDDPDEDDIKESIETHTELNRKHAAAVKACKKEASAVKGGFSRRRKSKRPSRRHSKKRPSL